MLSFNARHVIASTIASKKRDISDRHLAVHAHLDALANDRVAIAQQQADVAALTEDLERDDQARADAGEAEHPGAAGTGIEGTATVPTSWGELHESLTIRAAAEHPPVSLTGSHLTTTTTVQEG